MNDMRAIGIAEGFFPSEGPEETREAWQHLVDTGLAWMLQGWFGRTAVHLLQTGEIKAPEQGLPAFVRLRMEPLGEE